MGKSSYFGHYTTKVTANSQQLFKLQRDVATSLQSSTAQLVQI